MSQALQASIPTSGQRQATKRKNPLAEIAPVLNLAWRILAPGAKSGGSAHQSAQKPAGSKSIIISVISGDIPRIRRVEVETVVTNEFWETFEKLRQYSIEIPHASPLSYRHAWGKAREPDGSWRTVSETVSAEFFNSLVEPLREALGWSDFKLKRDAKYNEMYAEGVLHYARGSHKVSITVAFDEKTRSLIALGQLIPKSTGVGLYVPFFVLRVEGDRPVMYFSCNCPWARGESSQKKADPVYSDVCKHGIGVLYVAFPYMAAYLNALMKNGTVTREAYEAELSRILPAYDKVIRDIENRRNPTLEKIYEKFPHLYYGIVIANTAYLFLRTIRQRIKDVGGTFYKIVPPDESALRPLAKGLKVEKKVSVKEPDEAGKVGGVQLPAEALEAVAKTVLPKVERLRKLLAGLQGMTRSIYADALVAAAVLGSDLFDSPVLITSVSPPGTGKSLTATMLGQMVGVRKVRVYVDIAEGAAVSAVARRITQRVAELADMLAEVYGVDRTKLLMATTEVSRRLLASKKVTDTTIRLATRLIAMKTVQDKSVADEVAEYIYSAIKDEVASLGDPVKYVAGVKRYEMLKMLEELHVINSAEDKLNENSGSVMWHVLPTPSGYRVAVDIDLHYLLSRFGGDPRKVADVVAKLAQRFNVEVATEATGTAVIEHVGAENLSKLFWTREEDPVSPHTRLYKLGSDVLQKAIIMIDEASRVPELLARLLTVTASAAEDKRRTNIIIMTDNIAPLANAEKDPELAALQSRKMGLVRLPEAGSEVVRAKTIEEIRRMQVEGRLPLVTMDELYVLKMLADRVRIDERYEEIAYALPVLLATRIYLMPGGPTIRLIPYSEEADATSGKLVEVPGITGIKDYRLSRHIIRFAKALAAINGRAEVTEEDFEKAVRVVLPARLIPEVDVPDDPSAAAQYLVAKEKALETIMGWIRDYLGSDRSELEAVVASIMNHQPVDGEALVRSLDNPIAAAVFVRSLAHLLAVDREGIVKYARDNRYDWLLKLINDIHEVFGV